MNGRHCRAKTSVQVDGKMNPQDAGRVGNKLANAALIAASGFALSALVFALLHGFAAVLGAR